MRSVTLSHHRPRFAIAVSGFTLVELLVGLTVGAIVLLTLAASWSLVVRDQVYVLSVTALNNDLRSVMQIITQDARRAVAPIKADTNDQIVEVSADGSCVVFNAHVGGEEIGPEAPLRFVWSGTEGPTLVPSGYRLRNGNLEIWAPPIPTNETLGMSEADYQGFGRCDVATPATPAAGNWWTPLILSGDRGVFLDSFTVETEPELDAGGTVLRTRSWCYRLDDLDATAIPGRCTAQVFNDFNGAQFGLVEAIILEFELSGRVALAAGDRSFTFRDAIKVRNDWVIETF